MLRSVSAIGLPFGKTQPTQARFDDLHMLAEGFKGERAIVTPYNIRSYQKRNPITRQLFVTHIGYYPCAKFHYRERMQGAEENILIYCEKGKGWVVCRNEKHLLDEDCFFIIPANQKHAYGADPKDPWSIYWIHFLGDKTGYFNSIIGKPGRLMQPEISRKDGRNQLFDEIYQNLTMGYSPDNLEYASFCLMHYLASLKYVSQFKEVELVRENDLVQKTILFMKENLENKISLDDISNAIGYSRTRLNALFSQRTSYSPIEYYNQLKIQRACSYLQFSDLKIKEIAFRMKYYDPYHFSRAFRKEMEITPKAYRKRYKDGVDETGEQQ